MLNFRKSLSILAGLSAVVLGVNASHASLITTGASMPLFTGDAPFAGAGTTGTLVDDVQYAVFAPGQAPASLFGATLSAPTFSDFVYAYVVNNQAVSALETQLLNVGYASGSILRNVGHSEALGGNMPGSGQGASANSFFNLFYADPIAPGSSSDILYFTSPQAPTFASATTGNGGVNDQFVLPSPTVPEPASLGLLAMSGLAILRRRRVAK